ncbi:MAG: hypothetical protein KAH91_03050 [Thermoplasmatales archaeon]|nr:hypothetical protein [Thermoplasmatales archaeon]
MPRSGRLRNYINEIAESPRIEKITFIPPFIVLIVEIILIRHAIMIEEWYIIVLTTILLILSAIEIILVFEEIHEHYQRSNFDRILTIRLDDFVLERKKKSVKEVVEEFIQTHPHYNKHRNEIYHITCQIMETHKEEQLEKVLEDVLNKFIRRKKKMTVDDTIKAFLKKYPKYRKYRAEVYEKICQIKGETQQ